MTWLQRAKQYPALVFGALALLILLPLLKPGYVLTLDMIFTPDTAVPSMQAAGFPFYGFLWLLNIIFPGDFIQKIILVAIIVLAGWGMYRLVLFLKPRHDSLDWSIAAFFAGFLYICNPFTYSRFMTGQFMVLLGYALLPWFIERYMQYLARPTTRMALSPAAIALVIGMVSLHTLGMAGIIAIVLGIAATWRHRSNRKVLFGYARTSGAGIGIFVLLSSYWLIPFLTGKGHAAELVQSFNGSDQIAFATAGAGLGKIAHILSLQGFWADSQNLYVTASESYGWWQLILIVVLALVVTGFISLYQEQRRLALSFIVLGLVALVLASGTTGTIFASFNRWLTDVLPFFAGYREPQKFVSILAAIYAVCAAFGLARLWQWTQAHKQPIQQHDIAAAALVIPLLFSPLMVWGFQGQLRAQEYPSDWYAIERQLQTLPEGKVLFLPWHQYMRFSFADRIIANPADRFFPSDIIISNNPELKGLNHWTNDADQQMIEGQLLPDGFAGKKDMATQLRTRQIRYVMLAKEHDYQKYAFVHDQPGLQLVRDTSTMQLYEVK